MTSVAVTMNPITPTRESPLRIATGSLSFRSDGNADMIKITAAVEKALKQSELSDGTVTLFAPGATGALTTLEYEPGVVHDLQHTLDAITPPQGEYRHNLTFGDANGHSHVRAGLIGPSLVVPFSEGKLTLGIYQDLVFCDFDARPRERALVVQVMGI